LDRSEDAKEYYDFLLHKRLVMFRAHPQRCDGEKYPPFEMVLNSKMSYDRLSEKIGEKLGVEPTHLRFYTVNASSNNPRAAVKRSQNQTLFTILNPAGYGQLNMNQRNDALFFEVLDMSLAELDTKKSVKLILLSEGITKEVSDPCCMFTRSQLTLLQEQFDVLVPKNGQVEDIIDCLVKKAKIPSEQEAGRIRVYEISNHKFFRELERNYPVISINEYTTVIAERIPPEDAEVTDPTHFISVFQFHGEPSRAHGIPFRFLLKEGEKFSETKKRLEKRTGLKGKSFEKIKFAVVRRSQMSRPHYLTDGEQSVPPKRRSIWAES
jgi:ubiquitin carboxyl-terminal hydrolase 7